MHILIATTLLLAHTYIPHARLHGTRSLRLYIYFVAISLWTVPQPSYITCKHVFAIIRFSSVTECSSKSLRKQIQFRGIQSCSRYRSEALIVGGRKLSPRIGDNQCYQTDIVVMPPLWADSRSLLNADRCRYTDQRCATTLFVCPVVSWHMCDGVCAFAFYFLIFPSSHLGERHSWNICIHIYVFMFIINFRFT